MREQLGERGRTDPALADRLVPVPGRAALVLGVVRVDQLQPVRSRRSPPARPGWPSCRPGWPGRARPPRRGRCRSRRPATGGGRPPPGTARGPAPSRPDCARHRRSARPAAGAAAAAAAPSSSGSSASRTWCSALSSWDRRRPSCRRGTPPPLAPIAAPRRSACASVCTDRSTVAPVGEPRFTSSDAWMYAGRPRSPQPSRNARVLRRVAGGQRPAARVRRRTPARPRSRPRRRTAGPPWPARPTFSCANRPAGRVAAAASEALDDHFALRGHRGVLARVLGPDDRGRVEVDADPQAQRLQRLPGLLAAACR